MNYFAWLQFVQALATAYATSRGRDLRALGYLRLAVALFSGQPATRPDLDALIREYTDKIQDGTPTTAAELAALDARSVAIQAS